MKEEEIHIQKQTTPGCQFFIPTRRKEGKQRLSTKNISLMRRPASHAQCQMWTLLIDPLKIKYDQHQQLPP